MIARVLAPAHLTVDTGCERRFANGRAQQQMIDAQTGVASKAFRKYFQNV